MNWWWKRGTAQSAVPPREVFVGGDQRVEVLMEAKHQEVLSGMCGGRGATPQSRIVSAGLVCESAKGQDSNAVQVVVDGLLVGCVSKEAHPLASLLMAMQRPAAQLRCAGEIVGRGDRGRAEDGTLALWLMLPGTEKR